MSEQRKLHAEGHTIFETEHGILGRRVGFFEHAEDATEYVKLKTERDAARHALAALEVEISSRFGDYGKAPERMVEPLSTLILNARKALNPEGE